RPGRASRQAHRRHHGAQFGRHRADFPDLPPGRGDGWPLALRTSRRPHDSLPLPGTLRTRATLRRTSADGFGELTMWNPNWTERNTTDSHAGSANTCNVATALIFSADTPTSELLIQALRSVAIAAER